jgi:hypothetical protein
MALAAQQLGDGELLSHVLQLTHADSGAREAALLELSKKREDFPDLAPMLWHSFGTITALLQEIIAIYPALTPPTLTAQASNRVCNALALLQCVASHSETRSLFLSGMQDAGDRRRFPLSGAARVATGLPSVPSGLSKRHRRSIPHLLTQRTSRCTCIHFLRRHRGVNPLSTCG